MFGKRYISIPIGWVPDTKAILGTVETVRLDASSDELMIGFRGDLDNRVIGQVAIKFINKTGNPTYQVSLQGLTSTGDPDGTILGGGSPASVQWAPGAAGLEWVTLDNAYTAAQGEMFCVVIEDGVSGTTPDASNYIDVCKHGGQFNRVGPPYMRASVDTGGTWTAVGNVNPGVALRESASELTDVLGYPLLTYMQIAASSWAATDGHRVAQAWKFPKEWGSRIQLGGMNGSFWDNGPDAHLGIWDTSNNEIVKSESLETKHRATVGTGNIDLSAYWDPVWVETDRVYYYGHELDGSGVVAMWAGDAVTDANLSAFPGYPDRNLYTYNGSTWTKQTGITAFSLALMVTGFESNAARLVGGGLVN